MLADPPGLSPDQALYRRLREQPGDASACAELGARLLTRGQPELARRLLTACDAGASGDPDPGLDALRAALGEPSREPAPFGPGPAPRRYRALDCGMLGCVAALAVLALASLALPHLLLQAHYHWTLAQRRGQLSHTDPALRVEAAEWLLARMGYGRPLRARLSDDERDRLMVEIVKAMEPADGPEPVALRALSVLKRVPVGNITAPRLTAYVKALGHGAPAVRLRASALLRDYTYLRRGWTSRVYAAVFAAYEAHPRLRANLLPLLARGVGRSLRGSIELPLPPDDVLASGTPGKPDWTRPAQRVLARLLSAAESPRADLRQAALDSLTLAERVEPRPGEDAQRLRRLVDRGLRSGRHRLAAARAGCRLAHLPAGETLLASIRRPSRKRVRRRRRSRRRGASFEPASHYLAFFGAVQLTRWFKAETHPRARKALQDALGACVELGSGGR